MPDIDYLVDGKRLSREALKSLARQESGLGKDSPFFFTSDAIWLLRAKGHRVEEVAEETPDA